VQLLEILRSDPAVLLQYITDNPEMMRVLLAKDGVTPTSVGRYRLDILSRFLEEKPELVKELMALLPVDVLVELLQGMLEANPDLVGHLLEDNEQLLMKVGGVVVMWSMQ
jgi:hypothetical protein